MFNFYDGRSATDKGTLFQLHNTFYQRAVTKIVSVSLSTSAMCQDFINCVTKAYILAFALVTLDIKVKQLVLFPMALP